MIEHETYECLITKFLSGVKMTQNVNYLNKKSIRRNNQGITQYREAAKQIAELYPDRIAEFALFLFSDDNDVKRCCAVCMLELMHCSEEYNSQALRVIEVHMKTTTDPAEKRGFAIWLDRIHSKKLK